MRLAYLVVVLSGFASSLSAAPKTDEGVEYKLLATSKTSTLEKELNEAAAAGYRFEAVMGGETSFGGNEIVAIIARSAGAASGAQYKYKLLATSKTGTMQKEMNEFGVSGYSYRDQTIADTLFGGREVIVIMERASDDAGAREFKLLATKKTGTMQKELSEAALAGFRFRGVTVAKTTFGGNEVVVITERTAGSRE